MVPGTCPVPIPLLFAKLEHIIRRFECSGNDFGWGALVAVKSGGSNKVDGSVDEGDGHQEVAGAGRASCSAARRPEKGGDEGTAAAQPKSRKTSAMATIPAIPSRFLWRGD